ncbi:MAG: HYR domain-containing protein, partial [Bacteroidia bacterium]
MFPTTKAEAHGVQVVYCQLDNGSLRVYIEHWHGAHTSLPGNGLNMTISTPSSSVTQDLDADGYVHNTTLANLPGGTKTVLAACTTGSRPANSQNNWLYYDFQATSCTEPVTVTLNYANSVVLQDACGGLFPSSVTQNFYPSVTAEDIEIAWQSCNDSATVYYDDFVISTNDVCDTNPTITYSVLDSTLFGPGTTSVVVTVVNNVPLTYRDTFNVTIGDFAPPTALCLDTTLYLDTAGLASLTVDDINGGSSDICHTVNVTWPISGSFDCSNTGPNYVTVSVSDSANALTSTCVSTVTVLDTSAVTITCPSDTVLSVDTGRCGTVHNFAAIGQSVFCTLTPVYSQDPGTEFLPGVNTVTAFVVNTVNDSATCSFDITVVDSIAPVITTLVDTLFASVAPGSCDVSVDYEGAGDLYATGTWDMNLYKYDTGYVYQGVTPITYSSGYGSMSYTYGLEQNPMTREIFTIISSGNHSTRYLAKMNLDSSHATIIGSFGSYYISSFAFASDGTCYAVTGNGGTNPNQLCTIDLTTAATTFLSSVSSGGGKAIAYNPDDGYMYHWYGSNMEKINLSTYVGTSISRTGYFYGNPGSATYKGNGEFLLGEYYGYYRTTVDTSGFGTYDGAFYSYHKGLLLDNSSAYTANDACDLTITQIAGLPSGSVFPGGYTTNTFVATDPAGNSDTTSFVVAVTNPNANVGDTIVVSANNTYTSPLGNVYDTTGVYFDRYTNVHGCDSSVRIELTITHTIFYVDSTMSSSGSGSRWGSAFKTLQEAFDHTMAHKVDTLCIAIGTYYPTEAPDGDTNRRHWSLHLADSNVVICGGINPSTGLVEGKSILCGDLGGGDTSYHVLSTEGLDSNSLIANMIICDGKSDGTDTSSFGGRDYYNTFGGGLYNHNSSPRIENVDIINNTATEDGGGMYNHNSAPILSNVTIRNNHAGYSGGGMYNISGSSPILNNVVIRDNTAAKHGGGIYNVSSSSPILTDVTIRDNTAEENGGGMYNKSYCSPTMLN